MKKYEDSRDERIARASGFGAEAMRLHAFYSGKIAVIPKCPVRSLTDFSLWYTPGVAEPCRAIQKDPLAAFELTNKGNSVAIVSDGTRVLGLGDIGPMGALPVMEGKALIFKYLGGVDAFPLVLSTKDERRIVETVEAVAPGFGGINLEDIAQPKCFSVLEQLRTRLEIPVWHDDQQGTATVTLAGLINALAVVGKRMEDVTVAMIGAGAANMRIARMIAAAGIRCENIIMVDSRGILHRDRDDIRALRTQYREKWEMCERSNAAGRTGGIPEAMRGADVVIAASRPGPDVIRPEWVSAMASDAIVFAEANPVPEIWPFDAKEAGARVVATGRGDFPNQVNNSLGFPAIFRGALDVRATTITDEMCIAAARALAACAQRRGISEDYIIPTMEEWEVFPEEAVAVGLTAIAQGIARRPLSEQELRERAQRTIGAAREEIRVLMRDGVIPEPPER